LLPEKCKQSLTKLVKFVGYPLCETLYRLYFYGFISKKPLRIIKPGVFAKLFFGHDPIVFKNAVK
jgi:hypothetical protein